MSTRIDKLTNRTRPVTTLLEGAIFYGLITVGAFTAVTYGAVDPWSQAVCECAVFLLGLLWVIHGFIEGSWRIGSVQLVWPMIAFVVLAILQSLPWSKTSQSGTEVWQALSADPFESWLFALRTSALVLACLLLIRFTSSPKRLKLLVHAIIALAVATALFGIARQTLQHSEGFVLARLKPASGYGQFINKDHFAYLMEMAFGLIVGVALMCRQGRERVLLYLSALLVVGAALVLCLSRGGLLAMTFQIIFATLLLPTSVATAARPGSVTRWMRSLAARMIMVAVSLAIVIAGIAWLGGDQLATGVETAAIEMGGVDQSELREASRRRDIWRTSWRMFMRHPVAGAGLGGYWAEVPSFHEGSGVLTPQQAHNDYLEILASAGLIGAAIFVWFAFELIKQARKNIRAADGFQRAALLGAMVSVTGVAVHSLVDFGLHITINALVFVALLAIVSLNPFEEEGIAN